MSVSVSECQSVSVSVSDLLKGQSLCHRLDPLPSTLQYFSYNQFQLHFLLEIDSILARARD